MATHRDPSESAGPLVVADATCTACGCLCDDIVLTASGGRIVEARNACDRGHAWFFEVRDPGSSPGATIEGRPVTVDEALDRAAAILRSARAPIVLGLTATTVEAQAAAVAVADRIGAIVVTGHAVDAQPGVRAIQRVGRVSATLGEVKNRADLVVFWGVDPVTTHPRHWERYSVEPRGRFVPEGRAGRTVLVADAERTPTAERADHFLRVAPHAQIETLGALRALVKGVELDPRQAERATGVPWEELRRWADRMSQARYGALFYDAGLARSGVGTAGVEAALTLVRDLNARNRFVALALGGPGNPAGAEAVLTWQTGFPIGVDLRRGYPRENYGAMSPAPMIERGEVDAALIVADNLGSRWPASADDRLARLPIIVIAPEATTTHPTVSVALATATYGIHAAGTVVRSDGVSLPLRPALSSSLPTDRELLIALESRLR